MNCAPVIIPTLNRVDHLRRLINSLRISPLSKYTDIFIGLDYPPDRKYEDGYNAICDYLSEDFKEFKSFNVIKRSINWGYLSNIDDLINYVLSKHDRFIYMDDDLELSPNFLEYINKGLELYQNNEEIIAICGYSYPLHWYVDNKATVFSESFICPMWGTGFWRDKYNRMRKYIAENYGFANDAYSIVRGRGIRNMSDVCCREFVDLCLSPDYKNTLAAKVTDISIRMYMASLCKCAIMPVVSKVRNWGFDGTGAFCAKIKVNGVVFSAKTYSYNCQPIDDNIKFTFIPDTCNDIKANKALMNKFDSISHVSRFKTDLKLLLFLILGLSNYHRVTLALRRLKRKYGK